jgi:hypothetical protein
MTRRPREAAVTLALVIAAAYGCGADDPASTVPATPGQSTSTSSSTTPGTPSDSPVSQAGANAACDREQQKAVRSQWIGSAVWQLSEAPSGYSQRVSRDLARHLTRAEEPLRAACGGAVPDEFTRFAADIERATTTNRFGARTIDRVLAAWLRWSTAAGAPQAAQFEIDRLNKCRTDVYPHVDVSYRVWWRWTDTGKEWWIELTVDNRTGKSLGGEVFGHAKATEWFDDPFGPAPPAPGPGRDTTLQWGGSSADILGLPPGTSRHTIAPDADTDVHTTATGTLTVTEMTIYLQTGTKLGTCSVAVRQDLGG